MSLLGKMSEVVDKKDKKPLYDTAKGDELTPMQKEEDKKKKKKPSGFGKIAGIAGGIIGGIYGGPVGSAVGSKVGSAMFSKKGGQIEVNLKTKKKKKRVVRGVGAAKRGYGKATYSKKMY